VSRDAEITLSVQTERGTLLMGFMPREPFRERPDCEPFTYPQIVYQLPHKAVTMIVPKPVNDDQAGVAS
jgi:hypothetical protein